VKTYLCAREVLQAVEQVLTARPRLIPRGRLLRSEIRSPGAPKSPLEQVAGLLQRARHYLAVTIYLEAGGRLLRRASAGASPGCDSMRLGEGNVGRAAQTGVAKVVPDVSRDPQYVKCLQETRSELVTPIKIGAHVIGVIDVESERLNAFAFEDRVLLRELATVLARYLSGRGRYLVMKAREAAPAAPKQPRSEGQRQFRAAAGEKVRP
jgi:putative methionine-R-sulfoxide reductase with GAF domain